jgi:hypothetical protein
MTLPETLLGYEEECAAIRSWLRSDGWLHQDEFDRLSFGWRHQPRPCAIRPFNLGSIVPPMNGDPLLAFLQEMIRQGLAKARERDDGKVEYSE